MIRTVRWKVEVFTRVSFQHLTFYSQRDLLIFLEMKIALFVVCVLFFLLVPSQGASSEDKNVSTSTKVRLE